MIMDLHVVTAGYSVAAGEFSGDDEEGKNQTERRVQWPWKHLSNIHPLCTAMREVGILLCTKRWWWKKWLQRAITDQSIVLLLTDQGFYWVPPLSVLIVARDLSWPFSPSVSHCRLRHRSPERTHAVWPGKNVHHVCDPDALKPGSEPEPESLVYIWTNYCSINTQCNTENTLSVSFAVVFSLCLP